MTDGGNIKRVIHIGPVWLMATLALVTSHVVLATDDSVCRGADGDGQRASYCQAAESAKMGARQAGALWKVWAAAAAVCSYACYQSITGNPINSLVCSGANTAAGVTDAVVTKNFASALMAIGTAGMSYAQTRGGPTPQQGKRPADWGACMSAATAGFQALGKHSASKQSQSVYESSLDQAARQQSAASQNAPFADARSPAGSGGGAGGGLGGSAPIGQGGAGSPAADPSACAQASGSDGYQGVVACAIASDGSLPSFVTSPKLRDEFKTATGQELDEFVRGSDANGASTLAQMMSGGLNPTATGKLGEVVALLDQAIQEQGRESGSTYAQAGGGSRAPAATDQEPDLSEMMKSMFGGFLPTDKSGKAHAGVATVIFANQKRGPAALFEDRSISLFDRVTYRYGLLGRGMVQ